MIPKQPTLHHIQDGMYLHILGCGSAKPSLVHQPSAQMLRLREKCFLLDCGEGIQTQLLRYRVPIGSLHRIFITHLHGDHCLGLPGLLSTMSLQQLRFPMHIYGPKGIDKYVKFITEMFCPDDTERFHAHVVDHKVPSVVFQDRSITVEAVPLLHRIETVGYIFREAPKARHLNRPMADFHKVPMSWYGRLKAGEDYVSPEGKVVSNSVLTKDPRPPFTYAYITDTAYKPEIVEDIYGVDVLYHETTFEKEMTMRASQTLHSTTYDAAKIAQQAEVGHLLMGHYSSRYNRVQDVSRLKAEAEEIFPRVIAADEGMFLDFNKLRQEREPAQK